MLPYQYERIFYGFLRVDAAYQHFFPERQHAGRFMLIKGRKSLVVTLSHSDQVRVVIKRGLVHTGCAGDGTFKLKSSLYVGFSGLNGFLM